MKRILKKSKDPRKGAPSALILSIVIHVGLFFLAGMLIVFTVVQKEEQRFDPPQSVERPKMKLKKPKVRVKQSTKPKQATRIITKSNRAVMPAIELPEMSGMGADLGGAVDGFDLMPELGDVTVFGSGQSIGNDLEGTFYDFNRDSLGRDIPMDPNTFRQKVLNFVNAGWKPSEFAQYYRSPKKLYATTIMVPPLLSPEGPLAFGEAETGGYCWMVHYKGQLVHRDGIRFRFWGNGDDFMLVRVNGKVVLSACWEGTWGPWSNTEAYFTTLWQSSATDNRKYWLGNNEAVVGDWITLEPGVPQDLEIILGEVPGGEFAAMLLVEEEGVEYERNKQNGPILPLFRTAAPSRTLVDVIFKELVEGEGCVTNGPVFSDYDTSVTGVQEYMPAPAEPVEMEEVDYHAIRSWTTIAQESFDAAYVTMVGEHVVLRGADGREQRLPIDQLYDADRTFVELLRPPRFNIDFSKKSSQIMSYESPYNQTRLPQKWNYMFSTRLKQSSVGTYNHELQVEFFAIGRENQGKRWVLLDHQKSDFTPSRENNQSHSFSGRDVQLSSYHIHGHLRGIKYDTYLVVVTDSRGEIIQYQTPNEWLFENLNDLRRLPVGAYMDKTCTRRFPTRPITDLY